MNHCLRTAISSPPQLTNKAALLAAKPVLRFGDVPCNALCGMIGPFISPYAEIGLRLVCNAFKVRVSRYHVNFMAFFLEFIISGRRGTIEVPVLIDTTFTHI